MIWRGATLLCVCVGVCAFVENYHQLLCSAAQLKSKYKQSILATNKCVVYSKWQAEKCLMNSKAESGTTDKARQKKKQKHRKTFNKKQNMRSKV